MKFAALDISKNRIGLAISENFQILFHTTICLKNKFWKSYLDRLFKKHSIHITLIGLPVALSGLYTDTTRFVKTFTHGIREIIGKFEFIDERFSTQIAMQNNSKNIDEIVAINFLKYNVGKYI